MRNLQKRLQKLEHHSLARQQAQNEKFYETARLFLLDAIGYYFGDPKPGEMQEAWARAFGYTHWEEAKIALYREWPKPNERWTGAIRELFAKFGLSRPFTWPQFLDAVKRMNAGMSEEYKKRNEERMAIILATLERA